MRKMASLVLIVVSSLTIFPISSAYAWVFPPYQEIIMFSPSIVQGEPFIVQGTEPNFTALRFWLIGPDSFSTTEEKLNPQYPFVYMLNGGQTRNLTPGQYHLVIQFPGTDGIFDVDSNASSENGYSYTSLIAALNDPAVNDTYTDYVFSVAGAPAPANAPGPVLSISPVDDQSTGDTFVVQGTTELPVGTQLMLYIGSPTGFQPGGEAPTNGGSGGVFNTTTTVSAGQNQLNTWSATVATTTWAPGEYPVTVSSPDKSVQATSSFNLVGGVISVNPVTISAGNNSITVNGSATLPVGEVLNVSIQHEPLAGMKCVSPATFCGTYAGSALVTNDGDATNSWSLTADTTSFWSGNYSVTVSSGEAVPAFSTFISPVVIIPATERSRRTDEEYFRMALSF